MEMKDPGVTAMTLSPPVLHTQQTGQGKLGESSSCQRHQQ
jgi:hypothetical protein